MITKCLSGCRSSLEDKKSSMSRVVLFYVRVTNDVMQGTMGDLRCLHVKPAYCISELWLKAGWV